jgi:GNAT superfamily N-acetyltransferase
MQLTLDYLANHRELVPQLAAWSYSEWRHVLDDRGLTLDDVVAGYHGRTNTDALPLAIVAFADGELAGTGALKPDDLPPRPDLTPWLGGIFVAPQHRGRGVATAIVSRLLDEARRLRLPQLYLWTPSAAALYAKLGWADFDTLEYCGQTITLMVRELEAR